MNARLPSSDSKPESTADGISTTSPVAGQIAAQSTPRVVSLSPAAAGIEIKPLPMAAPMREPINAAGETSSAHPVAVEEHAQPIAQLRELLALFTELEPRALAASTSLHERLRLGARMLQAFAAQINRIEAAMAGLASRRTELDRTLGNIHTAHETLRRQTDQATSLAAERIESAAEQAVLRVQAAGPGSLIGSLADRIGALESRLRALEERAGATASRSLPPPEHVVLPRDSSADTAPVTRVEVEIRKQIGELAGAMRDLADRVGQFMPADESQSQPHSPDGSDHVPLRFQKWAGQG
jgi:hypothetical protein